MGDWISVDDAMPESGKNVLAYYVNRLGKYRIVKAYYAGKYSIESAFSEWTSDEINDEYSEEKEQYYLKVGWYECLDNWEDYSSIVISNGEVTHWMPLPNPPLQKNA